MKSDSCSDPITGPVYGLTFTDGVMMFRRLDDLQRLSEKTPRRGLVTYGGATHQVQAEDVPPVEQTALTIEALQQELLDKANTHLNQSGVDGRFVLELDMPQDADAWDVRVKAQWEAVAEPAVAEAVIEDLEKIFFGVFKQRKLLANIKIKHVVPAALPPSSRGASYAIPPVRY